MTNKDEIAGALAEVRCLVDAVETEMKAVVDRLSSEAGDASKEAEALLDLRELMSALDNMEEFEAEIFEALNGLRSEIEELPAEDRAIIECEIGLAAATMRREAEMQIWEQFKKIIQPLMYVSDVYDRLNRW